MYYIPYKKNWYAIMLYFNLPTVIMEYDIKNNVFQLKLLVYPTIYYSFFLLAQLNKTILSPSHCSKIKKFTHVNTLCS